MQIGKGIKTLFSFMNKIVLGKLSECNYFALQFYRNAHKHDNRFDDSSTINLFVKIIFSMGLWLRDYYFASDQKGLGEKMSLPMIPTNIHSFRKCLTRK